MPKPQTAQSHAKWDTLTHFVLVPIFLLNFGVAIYRALHGWHQHPFYAVWSVVIALALLLLTMKQRLYPLANQDRIIRLEERLRIAALVPHADVSQLSTRQLIALRFASDGELPSLVSRTLSENLDPRAIKANITTWRPDYERI